MSEIKTAIVPVTPFQQNCAIVWDSASRRGAVIDPGGDVDRILAAIDRHSVRVSKILLTHGHLDHAGGAEELRSALFQRTAAEVPIEGPDRRDKFLLDHIA